MDISTALLGLGDVFGPVTLVFVLLGVLCGQFVGALPGIGPVMTIAIAIPFTFTLDPLTAIAFLVGINKGGLFGGAIPAILINTPGTPDAAATALDGYPLAQQGKPRKAMRMALYASVTGDTFSDIVLITVSVPLAVLALKMGPVEVLALMVFAFSVIAGLVGDSLVKGLIAATLGVLAGTIGLDPEHGTPRLYFGYFELFEGLPLISVAVGMLAVAEIVRRIADGSRGEASPLTGEDRSDPSSARVSLAEYWGCRYVIARGAMIGTILGAIPGIGSTAAAFMSYASAKRAARGGAPFGSGNLEGIAAAESANSAVMGANLIPLLAIGIPGSISAALLISAFKIHGLQPGPLLFESQGRLVYGLFGAMIVANALNLVIGQMSLQLWSRVIRAPSSVIFPAAMIFCVVGVYLSTGGLFGVAIMLIAAALSFLMQATGYPVIVFIIAFFLAGNFERALSQSLVILDGDPLRILQHPIAAVLLGLAVLSAVWFLWRRPETGPPAGEDNAKRS